MDGYSVWDEASRDYDSEAHLTAQANLHVASNGVMQYLALAQSSDEFEGRLMLATASIQELSDSTGVPLDEVTASLRNRWEMLVEAGNVKLATNDTCKCPCGCDAEDPNVCLACEFFGEHPNKNNLPEYKDTSPIAEYNKRQKGNTTSSRRTAGDNGSSAKCNKCGFSGKKENWSDYTTFDGKLHLVCPQCQSEDNSTTASRRTAGDVQCQNPGCEENAGIGGSYCDRCSMLTNASRRTAVSAIDPEYAAKHLEVMPAERKGKFDSDGYPKRFVGDLDCPNCGSKEMEEGGDGEGRVDDRQCPDCGHQEFPVEGMRTKIPSTLDPKKISYRYSKVIGLKNDEGWENSDGSEQPAGDRAGHQVDALHDGEKVGHIKWLAEESEADGDAGAILDVRLGEAHQGQGLTNKLLGAARDAWKKGKANTRPYIRDDNDLGYWSSDAKNGKEWPSNKADEAEYEKSDRPADDWDEWHNKGQKGTTASRLNFNQAVIKTANQYVEKQGDKWVVTQKGTGKVLSHHDTKEDAEASFRAMMVSKHSGSRSNFSQATLKIAAGVLRCRNCGKIGEEGDFGDTGDLRCPVCGSRDVLFDMPKVSNLKGAAISFGTNAPQEPDAYGTNMGGDPNAPKFYPKGTSVDMPKSPGLSGGQSGTFNPSSNGGDIGEGQNSTPDPVDSIDSTAVKVALLIATAKVLEENPDLSNEQAHHLAMSTLASFPVAAAGWNPSSYTPPFEGAGMKGLQDVKNIADTVKNMGGPKAGTAEYFQKHQDDPSRDPIDPAHYRTWEKVHRQVGTAPAELQQRRLDAGMPNPEEAQETTPQLYVPPKSEW